MLASVLNWLKHVLPSLILFFCRLLQSFKIFHGFVSKREMIRLKMSPQFFRLHVFTAKYAHYKSNRLSDAHYVFQ